MCVCAKSNCMLRPCKQSSEHLYVCTFEWQGFGTAVKALRPPKPEPVSEIPGAKPRGDHSQPSAGPGWAGLLVKVVRLEKSPDNRPTGNPNPTWGHPVRANRQANVAWSSLRVDSCCRSGQPLPTRSAVTSSTKITGLPGLGCILRRLTVSVSWSIYKTRAYFRRYRMTPLVFRGW